MEGKRVKTVRNLENKLCMKCEPYETGFIEKCTMINCRYKNGDNKKYKWNKDRQILEEVHITTIGRKDDKDKPMLAQFYKHFPNAYGALVDVAMYGFKKYNEDIHDPNWKKVSIEQYEDALFRHFSKYLTGEKVDSESSKKHLAHIIWNACVLYELNEVQNENT